jgi:hypothetical protein
MPFRGVFHVGGYFAMWIYFKPLRSQKSLEKTPLYSRRLKEKEMF